MAEVNNPNSVMESQILSFAKSATEEIVANINTDKSKAQIQDRIAYFAKLAIDKVAKGESFDQIKTDLVKQVQTEVNAFIQTEGVQFVGNMLGQKTGSPIIGALLAQGLASQVSNIQSRNPAQNQQAKPNIPPAGAWVPPDEEEKIKQQQAQQQQFNQQQQNQQQPQIDPAMAMLGTLFQSFLGAKNPSMASNQTQGQAGGVDAQAMANLLGAVLGGMNNNNPKK